MIGLETERLIFRQWEPSDYEQFSKFYSDEKNARFVGGVKSKEEAYRLLATYIGHYELNGYSYLAVAEKTSKNLIGTVGLWNSRPWPEPELGYWILSEHQGKGFATEAGLAVKIFALEALKFDSLVSYIDPSNEASIQLALRLGAKYDSEIDLLDFGLHLVYKYW
ncbi:GNAT family N-acetyltransferase [Flagellimonas lutaonensis]|uniref:Acetyltransferase n=1 Tax=Flagellimonas lutaonensis TaxID=516051 RepID=A0A0D5YTZ9_9FLAO|nr:GNAT family N-acetyltransferase [Allomuricauda lutaonensis]AKA35369.1 Acetyltransferase [Allomuricauda lutaonensis]